MNLFIKRHTYYDIMSFLQEHPNKKNNLAFEYYRGKADAVYFVEKLEEKYGKEGK